jgi:beta-lactamase regulating signal transducer with metallopeptidase domain
MSLVHVAELIGGAGANWLGAAFAGFAQAAAPAAVAAFWQSVLVALAMVFCLQFLLRASAAHRFAAWAAGFAVAALLPLLPFFVIERSGAIVTTVPAAGARSWLELDSRWGFAIAGLWLAGSAFRAAELVFHSLRLRKLWRSATLIEFNACERTLFAGALPGRRVEICTTPNLDRPSVIGFFAPRILIPEWLYPRLTPGELEQVVLHEAEHLRRRDDWTNLLQKIALILFPLNPALAWMERRLCREREMACDEGVVRKTQAPRTYAACLAALAERRIERREFLRRAQALSLGAFERRSELVHRVHSILRRRPVLHPLAAGSLVGVMACGLLLGGIELSRGPQLVAFVAAPTPDSQAAALAPPKTGAQELARVSRDEASLPQPAANNTVFRPTQHFRAIETRAILPATTSPAPVSTGSRAGRRDEEPARTTESAMTAAENTPPQIPIHSAAPIRGTVSTHDQEFVVFTAWEEVRTSAPRARSIADYDTGADTQDQADAAANQPNANTGAQFTITRLILFVAPASAAPSAATGTAPDTKASRATTNQHARRPLAFGGGWLFFQL